MPAPRAATTQLARFLDAADQPIYLVDASRRLRFVNRACEAWLGLSAASLLGQECRYHTPCDLPPEARAACALCPPPEAFAGVQIGAVICVPAADPARAEAQVDFVPLGGGEERAVLALVSWRDTAPVEAEPSAGRGELHVQLQRLRQSRAAQYQLERLVGDSPQIRRVRSQIMLAVQGTAPVVIVGPPGSGRQHVARTIHYGGDARAAAGPLVPLACKLLGAELLQATIRAVARARSTAPSARPGTLLLNEVEQLPEEARAELAGFLRHADLPMRLISTARQPLEKLAAAGQFPQELALMLSAMVIELPPLSQRLEDLPLIAQAFVEAENAQAGKQISGFTEEALHCLLAYPWPGGMDELQAVVREAHARAVGWHITLQDLPQRVANIPAPARRHEPIDLPRLLADVERELIERALRLARGNKARAARLLGLTRPRLYRRMVAIGLETAAPAGPRRRQARPALSAGEVAAEPPPPETAGSPSEPSEIDFQPHADDA
jgi:transcriptional regulator with PAS, ATPase and Fis domain